MPRARPRRNPYKAEIRLVDDDARAWFYKSLRKIGGPLRLPHPSVTKKGLLGELRLADGGTLVLDNLQEWKTSAVAELPDEARRKKLNVTVLGFVDKDWHDQVADKKDNVARSIRRLASAMDATLALEEFVPPKAKRREVSLPFPEPLPGRRKKKPRVIIARVPRREKIEVLPERKFGSCRQCAVCVAYDIRQGCCTVCGRPLSPNPKKKATQPKRDRAAKRAAARKAPKPPAPQSIDMYISFVINAVMGRMNEADGLMRSYGTQIRKVAKWLRAEQPIKPRKLYRGILIEPERVVGGKLAPDPRLTFASYSADRDVACWFGLPDTYVSGFVKAQRPSVRGYVTETTPRLEDVLFHHSWSSFPIFGRRVPLAVLAQQFPDLDARQVDWNLRTQKEWILEPVKKPFSVKPIAALSCPSARELDAKLLPPFITGNPRKAKKAPRRNPQAARQRRVAASFLRSVR